MQNSNNKEGEKTLHGGALTLVFHAVRVVLSSHNTERKCKRKEREGSRKTHSIPSEEVHFFLCFLSLSFASLDK
jgi:hypothetical protein